MRGLLKNLVQQAMQGNLQNLPQMQVFNQMMAGKDRRQQIETLINMAKSKGLDVDAKQFTASDLRSMGLM